MLVTVFVETCQL